MPQDLSDDKSSSSLVPAGKKPSPEPMLTKFYEAS